MTDPYDPLVQDREPLNEVKYAARDYVSVFDALLRRLKIEYEDDYNDYASTAQGIMLIELMAYGVDGVQWYLDRTASDCFLETARTRAAVARLVKQIGYKMGAASAASVTETLTFPNGTTGPFTMPARWQYQGPDGLIYESYAAYNQPVALSPGDTIDVSIRQGETRLLTYTSDGTKNQQYRLTNIPTDRYLGDGTVDVWVDGLLWEEKEFLEFEKTNHYEVGYNDDPPIIQFGDGIAGNIPPLGAEIKIRFVIIDGEKGNVKADSITSSIDTLTIGGEEVEFTVTNASVATGGTEPEKAERAKRLAPFSFAARGAAITEQDYEALSNSYTDSTYGSVALAYAFNPRSAYEDIEFNSYVDLIEAYLDTYVSDMTTLENNINTSAQSLSTLITSMGSDLTNLETLRGDLETQVDGAITQNTSAKSSASSAESSSTLAISNCSDAETELNTLSSTVSGYPTGTGPTSAQKTAIINSINTALASVGLASDYASTSETSSGTAVTALNVAIFDNLNPAYDSIVNTPVAPAYSLPSIIADMTADLTSMTSIIEGTGGLQDQIAVIVGDAENLELYVVPQLTSMQARIGQLFNADCMSNYVQVPILSLDVDGNYSSPSVGLIKGLQSYLDGIKEVTQNVEVIDGSGILVSAEISIVLEVNKDAYIEEEVVSDVVATVIGILKGRSFNQPLYLSSLYDNITNTSSGITRANVEITGPVQVPAVIDSEGNLVPPANRVISFGSLIITDKDGNTLYQG